MVHHSITRDDVAASAAAFDARFAALARADPEIDAAAFFGKAGKQSYRLLAHLSSLFNARTIVHIGSSAASSLALAYSPDNKVLWFNLYKSASPVLTESPNIEMHTVNIFEDPARYQWKAALLAAPFIFVDVDPYTGVLEYNLYEFLKQSGYTGFVVYDNVWERENLRNRFWYRVPDECRYDLTDAGKETGTCVVSLDPATTFAKPDLKNWTLVTAYYNLTKCPDASSEIKARDPQYYMSHSLGCLSLPHNMVVYCDPESYPSIYATRPAWLREKTRYVIGEFDELRFTDSATGEPRQDTFAEYRAKIIQNRKEHPYHFDPRNTASYYLFCMARYMMLKATIQTNPFGSSHFCWINFCIQRMGYRNLARLDEALAVHRDKFSTTYIDYVPKHVVEDAREYFKFGRCSLCSGFFTGNHHYMYRFCDLMEDRFLYYLARGYGHSDETLMSPAYFKAPELVEWYMGDYFQMIANYKYVYDAPDAPIRNFVRNAFGAGDYARAFEGAKQVWNSFLLEKCALSKEDEATLAHYLVECKKRLKMLE